MRDGVFRQELSPVHFIERSGSVHADRVAVVDGPGTYTYGEWLKRSRRFASALRRAGLRKGERIAFVALNSEPLLLAHFAVPQAGGVLVAINTRLTPGEVRYIVEHSGSRFVFFSPELEGQLAEVPADVERIGLGPAFEAFLGGGAEGPVQSWLDDEYEPIAIDYTSGTTGSPKGVVYHHRGAHLNALGMVLENRLPLDAPDVPLQRVVSHVGRRGGRRHERLPAARRHPYRVGDAGDARRDALQRGADRAHHAREPPRGPPAAATGTGVRGRGTSVPDAAVPADRAQRRGRAPLRPDRVVRTRSDQRAPAGVRGVGAGGPGRVPGPAGRAARDG